VNNHLLNSNGIIIGDYCLQINQDKLVKQGLMEDPAKMPPVGSKKYSGLHTHLAVTSASVLRSGLNLSTAEVPSGFYRFGTEMISIPKNAGTFFTEQQAQEISQANFRELSDNSGHEVLTYLITTYGNYYQKEKINITLEWALDDFNTYTFKTGTVKNLVISGKISRLIGLYSEGYEFIIAQGIARLLGKSPSDSRGLTYSGAADFYAVSEVLRAVRYLDFGTIVPKLFDQINTLFGYIKTNREGDQNDLANNPGIECRLGALQNGIVG